MCRKVVSALVEVTSRRAERTKNTATVIGPIVSTLASTVAGDLVDDVNTLLQAAGVRQVSASSRAEIVKNVAETTKYAIATFSDISATVASTVSGAAKAYLA